MPGTGTLFTERGRHGLSLRPSANARVMLQHLRHTQADSGENACKLGYNITVYILNPLSAYFWGLFEVMESMSPVTYSLVLGVSVMTEPLLLNKVIPPEAEPCPNPVFDELQTLCTQHARPHLMRTERLWAH